MLNSIGVIDHISKARTALIQSLMAPVEKLLRDLRGRGEKSRPRCKVTDSSVESAQCEATILRTLVKALTEGKHFPLPDAATYDGSVEDLHGELKTLVPKIYPLRHKAAPGSPFLFTDSSYGSHRKSNQSNHTACGPASGLVKEINAAYSFRDKTIPEQCLTHIMKQAGKSSVRPDQVCWDCFKTWT